MMNEKIVYMGTPEIAVPSLEALIKNNFRIVGVYTQPDRKAGRKQKIEESPVKKVARCRELKIVQIEKFENEENIRQLKEMKPELIVVMAFGMILPKEVLELPRLGCINVHPSMLPKYRGASPIATAILKGERKTGVTIMLMDEGMDTGPILRKKEEPIWDEDTAGTLGLRLAKIGAELLVETIPNWVAGKIEPKRQDEREATYSRMINKEDGKVDWKLSSKEIWRKARAFSPWPGCYTVWKGKRLKLVKVIPLDDKETKEPGKVIKLIHDKIAVGVETGKGVLGLDKIQMEGKKEMTAEEFVRGQREFIGSRLL